MTRMSRPSMVLAWTGVTVVMHAAVPFKLSRVGGRARRQGGATSAARGAGLLTVAAGTALMTWAMATHYHAAPQGWRMDSRLTPGYLLRHGPYRLSRNPMFAGEAIIWLGWALFYRRPAVWAGLAIECAAFATIARSEERRLLARFGADYQDYMEQVPRWALRNGRAGRIAGHHGQRAADT